MTILFLLIPLAVVLMGAAAAAFLWALRAGQFDDLESPALRILVDDDRAPPPSAAADDATAERAARGPR